VFARGRGGAASYFAFPVFSRPWFWRRTLIFAGIATAVGTFQGVAVGVALRDLKWGVISVLVSVPIWIAIVTAGPAFATVVRHARWRPRVERIAVVLAIVAGLGVSFAGQELANQFSRVFLRERLIEARILPDNRGVGAPDNPFGLAFAIVWQTFIFLGIGGGPALVTYFGEQRRWQDGQRQRELDSLRQQKSEADLRLTVLQAQVEPHFLFNTLASVRSLVQQDPPRAEATIDALVDHLRATMPRMRGGTGEISPTLADQIEVCSSYLALMQVRMGERLQYRVDVPAELRALSFPPFILISLVENAIKHGVEPKPGGAMVWIRAELLGWGEGQRLSVSVEDDGLGLRPGLSDGVGLSNVRAQLAARFGDRASLTLVGQQGGGTCATVRVPVAEVHA
jgi:signal transduction histidine kinase